MTNVKVIGNFCKLITNKTITNLGKSKKAALLEAYFLT